MTFVPTSRQITNAITVELLGFRIEKNPEDPYFKLSIIRAIVMLKIYFPAKPAFVDE